MPARLEIGDSDLNGVGTLAQLDRLNLRRFYGLSPETKVVFIKKSE